jgi:hypothetical protein
LAIASAYIIAEVQRHQYHLNISFYSRPSVTKMLKNLGFHKKIQKSETLQMLDR